MCPLNPKSLDPSEPGFTQQSMKLRRQSWSCNSSQKPMVLTGHSASKLTWWEPHCTRGTRRCSKGPGSIISLGTLSRWTWRGKQALSEHMASYHWSSLSGKVLKSISIHAINQWFPNTTAGSAVRCLVNCLGTSWEVFSKTQTQGAHLWGSEPVDLCGLRN